MKDTVVAVEEQEEGEEGEGGTMHMVTETTGDKKALFSNKLFCS